MNTVTSNSLVDPFLTCLGCSVLHKKSWLLAFDFSLPLGRHKRTTLDDIPLQKLWNRDYRCRVFLAAFIQFSPFSLNAQQKWLHINSPFFSKKINVYTNLQCPRKSLLQFHFHLALLTVELLLKFWKFELQCTFYFCTQIY